MAACCVPAESASVPTCLKPEAIWQVRSVADPQFDPAGRRIVFVEDWPDILDDTSYSNLRIINADGTGGRKLTNGKYRDTQPRWSPDGSKLAYVSNRSGRAQIHVLDLVSGKDSTVTSGPEGPSVPAWSPDGKRIAFLRWSPGKASWDVPIPGKPANAKWAAAPTIATELRWTFDGIGVRRPGENRTFVVPASGGEERALTPEGFHHTSYLYEPDLTWAADSSGLLAHAVQGKDGWTNLSGGQIFKFPVNGSAAPIPLTSFEGQKAMVRSAPDGSLAFVGYPWKGQSYHVAKLYVAGASGASMRTVTADWDRDVTSPVWSSDSRKIYFLSEDHGSINLYETDLAGHRRQITQPGRRLSGLSVAASGMAAAIESSDRTASSLKLIPLDGSQGAKTLFDPNAEFLKACPLAASEEITYQSFDGPRIQGWIIKPPNFDPQRKYPLLVSIHGGPHAMYAISFQHELQMYAAKGYVVLYTNPRGSTGYGETFGNVIQHKWPGDDIKDIMAGIDFLLARGFIDSNRLAVMGGSGGGLMTSWIVTQTNRFRAAVSLYPVTNWFTHAGSDDNGFYIANVYRKGMPWDQPDDYMKHSPLFFAQNVTTPTMIITGEDDWRTPIAQSNEFFRALKVRGVDTVFVRVPGEPHGFRRHPSHRLAAMVHAMAWFDKYIPLP